CCQGVDHFKKIQYADGISYGELFSENEKEMSAYYLEHANVDHIQKHFDFHEEEARCLLELGLAIPAYDQLLKTSHCFNILDSRGYVGVTERARYFGRMRSLARQCAQLWLNTRESLGHPLGVVVEGGSLICPSEVVQSAVEKMSVEPRVFVLEIGTEELPPQDVAYASQQLKDLIMQLLEKQRLSHQEVQAFATPRRLVVSVNDLCTRQVEKEIEVRGPPVSKAFDNQGNPTKALEGFCRRYNISSDVIYEKVDGKTPYVYARVMEPSRFSLEVLAEDLPGTISKLAFPKSMRWNSQVMFSRPIRWIMALHGDTVIPFTFAGVFSGNLSHGLRNRPFATVKVESAESYTAVLKDAGISVDVEERRKMILERSNALAGSINGKLILPSGLLDEVLNLIEAPMPILGKFDVSFLMLPKDLLTMVMQKHQKYFGIADNEGRLLPYFIAVANGDINADVVRKGNEAVLRARYEDAKFFYETDTRKKLIEFRGQLSGILFQEKLGTMLDKMKRVEIIVEKLASSLGFEKEQLQTVQDAASLAMSDLATAVVTEFTSLSGIMARHYALRDGYSQQIAEALFEITLPRHSGDILPKTDAGNVLAIADRLDSLVGLFAAGCQPSSSNDPFGLRRISYGLVQLLVDNDINLDLRWAMELAAKIQPVAVDCNVLDDVDKGLNPEVVRSILLERGNWPCLAAKSAVKMEMLLKDKLLPKIIEAYSRPTRIVRGKNTNVNTEVNEVAFETEEEKALWNAFLSVSSKVHHGIEIDDFVQASSELVQPLANFFDNVFVMVEDEQIRKNRLALLQKIADLPKGIADLSALPGHTFPLLDLAKVMSFRGVKVTIITTPSNAKQISSYFALDFSTISTHVIPFPVVDGLPLGCENTKELISDDQRLPFLRATLRLKQPFESYLRDLLDSGDHPICVISDFHLGWAITVCASFNIPGLLFYGMGVLSTEICCNIFSNDEYMRTLMNGEKLENLSRLACPFPLILDDFPSLKDENCPSRKFFGENGDDGASSTCWGVLCNSFEELEGEFVRALEDFYGRSSVKVWCVGPLLLNDDSTSNSSIVKCGDQINGQSNLYQSWLEEQHEKKEGVIYVSFGTQSHISKPQMDEIALGLDSAGHRFIWVVRSSSWTPPSGWEERVKGRGLVIREWVDQRNILAHPSIRGFLSHCGWNSVLESLSMGVPILAWPMDAEQPVNAKLVVNVLKVGLAIDPKLDEVSKEGVIYGCDAISSGVKELMGEECGRLARKRAKEIELMAKNAVNKDDMANENPPPHAIIFPLMAQGHTFPLLDLAKVLSFRGVKVTIITTPSNAKQISSHFGTKFSPTISTHIIPFPVVDGLPLGCENTKELTTDDQRLPFLKATLKLKQPFESYLKGVLDSGDHPTCVISDFLLGWAITVCASFNIPGLVFYGMGVLPTEISRTIFSNDVYMRTLLNGEKLETGLACPFPLILDDLPSLRDENCPSMKFFREYGDGDAGLTCWGVLCNSFEELEGEFVKALEDTYGRSSVKVWCVGPLLLYEDGNFPKSSISDDQSNLYQSWLDEQHEKKECVIYVSFGTQSHISKSQMDEIALGLDLAGHRFIWVVRSSSWTPPSGWEERVKGRGLVIREWVDQRSILAHPAIGGFLSHCGWNSVLESLSMGVPILAWPMAADQPLNAKLVVHVLKAGLAMDPKLDEVRKEGEIYGCNAISSGVKELMGEECGRLARKRAKEIGIMARNAVQKDGSSSKKLDQMIKSLKEYSVLPDC
ncbi:hypothetical protein KSS87_000107, partial [Heliosperma pusillum]